MLLTQEALFAEPQHQPWDELRESHEAAMEEVTGSREGQEGLPGFRLL